MQIHELNTFSGTPSSNNYFAIDNGTDTGKISGENLLAPVNARIDNIVSGVTVDSEVIDGRIGADGITYGSLGASIRTQVDNLKESTTNKNYSIKNIVALTVETPSYSMQTGKVISSSGVISSASGDAFKITDYIPVEAGQVVAFKYSRARWGNQNWAFYDADKNVVSTYGKTSSGITVERNQKIIVPYRAKYVVVGRDIDEPNNEPSCDVMVITKYAESLNPESVEYKLNGNMMTETAYVATDESGKVIGSTGGIVSADSSYLISTVDVSFGDIINIYNCQTRYTNKMYAFYDASDLPILMVERVDTDAHDFLMIKVPFGASKLVVSGYNATYPTIKKVTKITNNDFSIHWADKKWACMGDSITDANNARATKRYHDYISEATGINVINLGVSGTGYMKPYNDGLPFHQRVDTIPSDSDVITIFGSGNDCNQILGSVTDTGTDTVCGCINKTIDGIRARIVGANIGIIAPTPWQPYPTETVGNKMDLYVEALAEICKRKGVPFLDLYHCSNMRPWEQSFREAFYTHDDGNGTHPDENGHKFFAPHIKAFLETLLM